MNIPIGITSIIGKANTNGKVINIVIIAAILLNTAGAKSINNNFSNFTVPSKHLFILPCIFPVIFSLKYDSGAISKELITIPLACFSVLVAVSSTITLRTILITSFATFTTNIKIKNGITFENDISLLVNISSVNHPIALGVICVKPAETIIINTMMINDTFCFLVNILYNFFITFFIDSFFTFFIFYINSPCITSYFYILSYFSLFVKRYLATVNIFIFSNYIFLIWKLINLTGVDINLQFPAGWAQAKEIKYAQGFDRPAPRDFVGYAPLTATEAVSIYNFIMSRKFSLMLTYHTQGEVIYWQFQNYAPANSLTIANTFSRVSGYRVENTPYESSFAGLKDWFVYYYRLPGFTIEAGSGTNPLPINDFNSIYSKNLGILVNGMLQ